MREKKKTFIFVIVILLLSIGIGYAFLNTNLNIDATTSMRGNTWDVHWTNARVAESSAGFHVPDGGALTIDPTNPTSITFHFSLDEPGDYVILLVDVVNNGSIDAMVDDITISPDDDRHLKIVGTYDDGIGISERQLVPKNTTQTYKFKISYNKYISKQQMQKIDSSRGIWIGVRYEQATKKAIPRTRTYYTASDSKQTNISYSRHGIYYHSEDEYSTPEDALQSWESGLFLKHVLAGGEIDETMIGFQINSDILYLRGGDASYDEGEDDYAYNSQHYLENITTLNTLDCNCSSYALNCECSQEDFTIHITAQGKVYIMNNVTGIMCHISETGDAACFTQSGD